MTKGIVRYCALVLAFAAFHTAFPGALGAQSRRPVSPTESTSQPLQFSLPDQEANLPAGQPDGQATLLLRIEGANLPQTPPTVRDHGYPNGYTVEQPQLVRMSSEPGAMNWLVLLNVRGFRPVLGATRYLSVVQGSQSALLQYSLNNNYGAAFQWKIFAPAAAGMVWRRHGAMPITIAIGGTVPATDVSLAQSVLIDADSGARLDLGLCMNSQGDCVPPSVLPAQQIHTLYLRQRGGAAILPGNYAGSLVIAAAEKPDGETIPMSLHFSLWWLKLLGVFAVAAGVGLSWLLTVVVRNALTRKELERPLAQFDERKYELARLVEATFPDPAATVPTTVAALARAGQDIARARTLLPPGLPTPWQGQWARRTDFESLTAEIGARLNGLDVVVREGLVTAANLPTSKPGQAEKVRAAIDQIDAEAGTAGAKPLDEVKVAVQAALAVAQDQAFDAADVPAVTLARLDFQIALLSGAAWFVILSLTVLAGAMAVISPDKGFGHWEDFVVCLLWGFGIPIAGGQLTSIGTEQVRNALSVSRPS